MVFLNIKSVYERIKNKFFIKISLRKNGILFLSFSSLIFLISNSCNLFILISLCSTSSLILFPFFEKLAIVLCVCKNFFLSGSSFLKFSDKSECKLRSK